MEKLEDDRGTDIRHDSQGKNRHPRHALACEKIHESQDRASLHLPKLRESRGADSRTRDLSSDAIDRQQEQSEDNPFPEIRNAENVPYAV